MNDYERFVPWDYDDRVIHGDYDAYAEAQERDLDLREACAALEKAFAAVADAMGSREPGAEHAYCMRCFARVELICHCGEGPNDYSHSPTGYSHDFVNYNSCSCSEGDGGGEQPSPVGAEGGASADGDSSLSRKKAADDAWFSQIFGSEQLATVDALLAETKEPTNRFVSGWTSVDEAGFELAWIGHLELSVSPDMSLDDYVKTASTSHVGDWVCAVTVYDDNGDAQELEMRELKDATIERAKRAAVALACRVTMPFVVLGSNHRSKAGVREPSACASLATVDLVER